MSEASRRFTNTHRNFYICQLWQPSVRWWRSIRHGTGFIGASGASQSLLSRGQADLGGSAFGLSGQEAAARQAFGLGSEFMGRAGAGMGDREQEVFERLRAIQAPEEERQRLALEERLLNQGRLGVRTNMFGGTPDSLLWQKLRRSPGSCGISGCSTGSAAQRQQAAIGAQFAGLGSNTPINDRPKSAQQLQALRALTGGTDIAAKIEPFGMQLSALGALQTGQGLISDRMALQGAQQLGLGALTGAFVPQLRPRGVTARVWLLHCQRSIGWCWIVGEASMGGLEALLGSALGQAGLMGDVGTGLLSDAGVWGRSKWVRGNH